MASGDSEESTAAEFFRKRFKAGRLYGTDVQEGCKSVLDDMIQKGAEVPKRNVLRQLSKGMDKESRRNKKGDQEPNSNAHTTVMRVFGKRSKLPPLYRAKVHLSGSVLGVLGDRVGVLRSLSRWFIWIHMKHS